MNMEEESSQFLENNAGAFSEYVTGGKYNANLPKNNNVAPYFSHQNAGGGGSSINSILANFKKEKEIFNKKFNILKTKLDNVSQASSSYEGGY